jgi:hypothetical protein
VIVIVSRICRATHCSFALSARSGVVLLPDLPGGEIVAFLPY